MSIGSKTLAAFAAVFGVLCPGAAAAADHCDDLMATSRSLRSDLTTAMDAMKRKDITLMKGVLPALERKFDALPAVEIVPEVCVDHVNAYTTLQFTQLATLKARGLSTGFPAQLPIVKQPDLNHGTLAYSVGWIKLELGDFAGAKAAYAKGLKLYPHEPALQSECMATLVRLNDAPSVVAFAQQVLADTPTLTDAERAKTYRALGIAYQLQNDRAQAASMLQVSQKYEWTQEAEDLLKKLDAQGK